MMMTPAVRAVAVLAVAALASIGCQSPTNPDDTLDVDDILEITAVPDPVTAEASTDGRTYRVVRGNNQPDDILEYDWKAAFVLTLTFNGKADDDDNLTFPVDLTTISAQVRQASGGIVTPPAAGENEYYSYVTQASSNRFTAVNQPLTIAFDVWYDLPSLRKEAVVTVNLIFKDDDGQVISTSYDVRIAP